MIQFTGIILIIINHGERIYIIVSALRTLNFVKILGLKGKIGPDTKMGYEVFNISFSSMDHPEQK